MPAYLLGSYHAGRLQERADEWLDTRFACALGVPLWPIASRWVTNGDRPGPDRPRSVTAVPLAGASVLAGYARWLLPIVAGVCFVVGSPGAMVACVVMLAVSSASWRWRRLRGAAACRHRDFRRAAYGTGLDPARWPPSWRGARRQLLADAWAGAHPAVTPLDVARRGPRDPAEAVAAFGLLYLDSLERGAGAAQARDGVAALLRGEQPPAADDDGPYRAVGGPATVDRAEVAAAIDARVDHVEGADQVARRRRGRWRRVAVASTAAALLAVGGVAGLATDNLFLEEPPLLDATIIDSRALPYARVTCDRVEGPLFIVDGSKRFGLDVVSVCWTGGRALAVRHADTQVIDQGGVTGRLRPLPSADVIWRQQWQRFDDLVAAEAPNSIEASEGWRWWRAMSRLLLLSIPLALLGMAWCWRRRADRRA